MAEFTVNAQRFDPYKNFKFRVKWDNKYVAGVSKMGALKRTTEVVKHREGGDPSSSRKSPGRTEYEAITLERGVTHDKEFEQWANKVWDFGAGLGSEVSLKDFRKEITLEVYNEAGQLALAYNVYRCWVSEFQALPDQKYYEYAGFATNGGTGVQGTLPRWRAYTTVHWDHPSGWEATIANNYIPGVTDVGVTDRFAHDVVFLTTPTRASASAARRFDSAARGVARC